MLRGVNSQLETYPADFENKPIPNPHILDQLRINTDTGVTQYPDMRDS